MATRRVLKAVLHNFLGTFTSRYSDHGGNWVFGLIEWGPQPLQINLLDLNQVPNDHEPKSVMIRIAILRFSEQMAKSRLNFSWVQKAELTIDALEGTVIGTVSHHPTTGQHIRFALTAECDYGKCYRSETIIFVAPHDPQFELWRAR